MPTMPTEHKPRSTYQLRTMHADGCGAVRPCTYADGMKAIADVGRMYRNGATNLPTLSLVRLTADGGATLVEEI